LNLHQQAEFFYFFMKLREPVFLSEAHGPSPAVGCPLTPGILFQQRNSPSGNFSGEDPAAIAAACWKASPLKNG
jgi:hypothetical protein